MRKLLSLVATGMLGGCGVGETTSLERFAKDGQLIALSGAGAGAASACFTCHGLDGGGDGAGAPRLAGLDPGYLERQLDAYADGRRHHAQMRWIAGRLDARERREVSAFYAGLPVEAGRPVKVEPERLYHRGDPARGLAACAACHGAQGQGMGPANPPLAGQPAAYLAEQIDQWRKSKRRNDPGDVMLRISQLLTPSEQRMLAAYASRLPGGPPSQEFRAASPATRRGDPRSGASGPPLHEPESARAGQ